MTEGSGRALCIHWRFNACCLRKYPATREPDIHVPRRDGAHMAGNLSALEDLDSSSSLPITVIVINSLGAVEDFPLMVIACSEHLYKFGFIILLFEMKKRRLKRLGKFPKAT